MEVSLLVPRFESCWRFLFSPSDGPVLAVCLCIPWVQSFPFSGSCAVLAVPLYRLGVLLQCGGGSLLVHRGLVGFTFVHLGPTKSHTVSIDYFTKNYSSKFSPGRRLITDYFSGSRARFPTFTHSKLSI